MQASKECLNLIKRFEGLYLKSYVCPAGILTIGYGHTKGVKPGEVINGLQADIYLKEDLKPCEDLLNGMNVTLNQNQFDALCSFIFNVGRGNFLKSTLLKKLKVNPNDVTIADEFKKWNRGGGNVLPGLVKRRQAESDLYFI